MSKLLTIDYSTTSSGWALFDTVTKALLQYGVISPGKLPKGAKLTALETTLIKLEDCAKQFLQLVEALQPESIVVEQINRGVSRISQKTLDGGHWLLYQALRPYITRIKFRDSDGATGWRRTLNLNLTESDKALNKRHRELNKKLPKGTPKFLEVTKKTLAWRLVNRVYDLQLDGDARKADCDLADAIGLGIAELYGRVPEELFANGIR